MILKKPYAFLIKNFKLIHLISIIGLVFVVSKTNGLISFFSSYSNSGNYLYNNTVVAQYISLSVFGIVLLIIGLFATIGYLLKKKQKPYNVYAYECVYYVILLFFLFYINTLISGLGDSVLDGRAIRIYRDITLIITLPQYIFIVFNFVRGIGFDIKKFDFNKDLVDIKVESGDDEEIEFEIGAESYKYKRSVRRFIRELSYYVLENKIGFAIGVGVLIIGCFIFIKTNATDSIEYSSVGNAFQVDNFTIKVNEAAVTKFDYNGNIIDGNYYLLINVDIYNPLTKRKLNDDNIFLVLNGGDKIVYPSTIYKEKFFDMGQVYVGDEIKHGETINRILVYPFRKKDLSNKYLIRSIKKLGGSNGALSIEFNNFKTKADDMYELDETREVKLGEKMSLAGSTLRNSEVIINNFEFMQNYNYNYNFCITKDDCVKSYGVIKPTYNSSSFKILVLDYETVFSENILFDLLHPEDFFEDFMYIEYTINGETKRIKTECLTDNRELFKGKYITQVKTDIVNADSINLVFPVRTKTFKIILK